LDLLGRVQRKLYNYGQYFFFLIPINIYLFAILRIHARVSTVEPQTRQAIPFNAFMDAVEEYEVDSETDDEGDQMNA